jgi:hypothetical protein
MIPTPYRFEANVTAEQFQKIGQFTLRWSHMDNTIANCLRRLLDMDPKQANVMIFPLSLDQRFQKIGQLSKHQPFTGERKWLFEELKPLIFAMQYIRNTVVHGVVIDFFSDDDIFFNLRSKNRNITIPQLLECEDLINYSGHVTEAFRLTFGEKDDNRGEAYTLPDRPPIPEFLPKEAKAFPLEDTAAREGRPKA